MRKLYVLITLIFFVVICLDISISGGNKAININNNQEKAIVAKKINQFKQTDTAKIIFDVPSIKCGQIAWKDTIIKHWLAKFCVDKCNDSFSSGYKFSGKISNSNKNSSLKVTIKTDREYAQPIRFDPESGKFSGKVYFDKSNRLETQIKIMLRDSDNEIKNTFIIMLTE